MSDTKVKRACLRLSTLREQLPLTLRGGQREQLRVLFDKLPSQLASKAEHCRRKMMEVEARVPYSWTFEQLGDFLSALISSGSSQEAHHPEQPEDDEAQLSEQDTFTNCLNCGSSSHRHVDCKARCRECGLQVCGGARLTNPKCMTMVVKRRGKIPADATGLDGRPLKESVCIHIKARASMMKKPGFKLRPPHEGNHIDGKHRPTKMICTT